MATKRMAPADAPGRSALIAAAVRLVEKVGYVGLTAANVAEEAGLRKQLLFYYFRDMDQLIRETFRNQADAYHTGVLAAFASEEPLRAFWNFQQNRNSALFAELMLLASRDDALRCEIIAAHAAMNSAIEVGVSSILERTGEAGALPSARVIVFLMSAVARSFATEKDLGMLQCEDELAMLVETFLDRFGSAKGDVSSTKTPVN